MILNIFPVNIEFDKFQIYSEPYSEERIGELRKNYNSTHSFFRNGDSIYISNKDGNDSISLGNLVEKSTLGDHEITSSLIKHLFFRTFKDRFGGYIPVDFYPFRFFQDNQRMISYTKLCRNT